MVFAALGAVTSACTQSPQRAGEGERAGASPSQEVAGAEVEVEAEAEAEAPARTATIPAQGWNDEIAWRGLDEGLAEAERTGRPVMLVVHTSWCSKCRALKGEFNGNASIEELSREFVMVHADQDEVPEMALYAPDGTYIPRVMFLDAQGKLDRELANPNRITRYRYFYTPQEDLVGTMREALDRHGNKS
nr:thioredoxin family protein [Pseudenhygromyxa sp. WMMC2535]